LEIQLGIIDQEGRVLFDETPHIMEWGVRCASGKRRRVPTALE
jgi:hypothetical protein